MSNICSSKDSYKWLADQVCKITVYGADIGALEFTVKQELNGYMNARDNQIYNTNGGIDKTI